MKKIVEEPEQNSTEEFIKYYVQNILKDTEIKDIKQDKEQITYNSIENLKVSYEQQINFLNSQISFYKWINRILFIIIFLISFFQIFSYL